MADLTQDDNVSSHLDREKVFFFSSGSTRAVLKLEGQMPEARESLITEVI